MVIIGIHVVDDPIHYSLVFFHVWLLFNILQASISHIDSMWPSDVNFMT